jgi:hypothetical protein
MTEYSIREVARHQWLVFADRQSIALCASENEAVKIMTEHSANSRRSRDLLESRTKHARGAGQRAVTQPKPSVDQAGE